MSYSPASLLNPVSDYGGAPSVGAPVVYVVRHAENDDDAENKIRGLKDQPINEHGESQLKALRAFFDGRLVGGVLCDDLKRTKATAMAIAGVCGCGVEVDLGLRSWDVGSLEGKSMAAHKLEIQDFKTHPDKVPVAGESWGEFERTAIAAMGRLVRRAMESSAPLVLVTHGSFIQIFFQQYGDLDKDADYDKTPLDQTGVAALFLTREGSELKILRGDAESPDE